MGFTKVSEIEKSVFLVLRPKYVKKKSQVLFLNNNLRTVGSAQYNQTLCVVWIILNKEVLFITVNYMFTD